MNAVYTKLINAASGTTYIYSRRSALHSGILSIICMCLLFHRANAIIAYCSYTHAHVSAMPSVLERKYN